MNQELIDVFFELECFPDPDMRIIKHFIAKTQNISAFILDALLKTDMPNFFIFHKNIFESQYRWFNQRTTGSI